MVGAFFIKQGTLSRKRTQNNYLSAQNFTDVKNKYPYGVPR